MNVKQLIKLLEKQDPKAKVILSSDEEGNTFHELPTNCLGWGNWDEDQQTYYSADHTASECCMDSEEYERMRELPLCVVLFP